MAIKTMAASSCGHKTSNTFLSNNVAQFKFINCGNDNCLYTHQGDGGTSQHLFRSFSHLANLIAHMALVLNLSLRLQCLRPRSNLER
jgi:hypothetical protein